MSLMYARVTFSAVILLQVHGYSGYYFYPSDGANYGASFGSIPERRYFSTLRDFPPIKPPTQFPANDQFQSRTQIHAQNRLPKMPMDYQGPQRGVQTDGEIRRDNQIFVNRPQNTQGNGPEMISNLKSDSSEGYARDNGQIRFTKRHEIVFMGDQQQPENPKTTEVKFTQQPADKSKCRENEVPFSVDNSTSDFYCDCGPRYLYYPAADSCFLAYRQGPCRPNQYIILQSQKVMCETNRCRDDDYVWYGNQCHKIGTPGGPCPSPTNGGGILNVNPNTFQLECEKIQDATQGQLNIINVPLKNCPPGSKRNSKGHCRKVV